MRRALPTRAWRRRKPRQKADARWRSRHSTLRSWAPERRAFAPPLPSRATAFRRSSSGRSRRNGMGAPSPFSTARSGCSMRLKLGPRSCLARRRLRRCVSSTIPTTCSGRRRSPSARARSASMHSDGTSRTPFSWRNSPGRCVARAPSRWRRSASPLRAAVRLRGNRARRRAQPSGGSGGRRGWPPIVPQGRGENPDQDLVLPAGRAHRRSWPMSATTAKPRPSSTSPRAIHARSPPRSQIESRLGDRSP